MILTYAECELCGGYHDDSLHGEAVLVVDHGRDTIIGGTHTLIQKIGELLAVDVPAMAISEEMAVAARKQRQIIIELRDEATQLYVADKQIDVSEETLEHISEFCADVDDKLSAILSEAGYVLYNNADSGAWLVFGGVEAGADDEHTHLFDVFKQAFVQASHDQPSYEERAANFLIILDAYGFKLDMKPSR